MTVHVCLSGTSWCAGLNPCPACHQVVLTKILPHAMVGGGFNGSREQAQAFFFAYNQARTQLLQELSQLVPPTLNGAPPEAEKPFTDEEIVEADMLSLKDSLDTPLSDEELSEMGREPEHSEWEMLEQERDAPPEVASEPRKPSYAGSTGTADNAEDGKLAKPSKARNKKARSKKQEKKEETT